MFLREKVKEGTLMSEKIKTQNKKFLNGLKKLGKSYEFTDYFTRLQLLLYIMLCVMFGVQKSGGGLIEIAAFFSE